MHNDSKYNDELAQHSLILSSLANGETINLKQGSLDYGTLDIGEYLSKLGFESILSSTDSTLGSTLNYYIGYKTVDYYGKRRGVVGIFLGGLNDENAYNKFVCTSENLSNSSNIYDEIAEKVKEKISVLKINDFSKYDLKYCYYISGKGIAGGVASTLASKVKTDDLDVYCYTFSSPMTHMGSKTDNFTCIKNIINEDDYLVKVYGVNDNIGNAYHRFGQTYNASVMYNCIYNYKKITNNNPKYTGDYQKINSIIKSVIELRTNHSSYIEEINTDLSKMLAKYVSRTNNSEDMQLINNIVNTENLATSIRNQVGKGELKTASSIEAYWTLAKTLEGLDEQTINGRKYDKTIEKANSEKWDYERIMENREVLDALKDVAVWYVNHIATYQNNLRVSRGTSVAETYHTTHSCQNTFLVDANGNRLTDKDTETVIKTISDSKLGYFYEPFADFATSNNEDYNGDGTNKNYLKRYLGDDCSGFTQGLIYTLSDGNRGQEGKNPNIETDTSGLWNHNVNSDKLIDGSYDTDNAMLRLGYEKYYLRGNTWYKKKLDEEGNVITKTFNETYGNSMSDYGVNFLEPGDILCASNHVEFYVGYNYNVTYYEGKDKYDVITRDKKYGIESIELGKEAQIGHSTFGWGNVQNEYPKQNYYFSYITANNTFRLNYSLTSYNDKKYTVIWRRN
ncbi:MAG: hypothetical protein Q4F88_05125 [Eubacteriales bacterium]|nr:hypothetical protein [Eubacteriales bacterium]